MAASSEIDDIFASKGPLPAATSSKPTNADKAKKKKKKKSAKRQRDASPAPNGGGDVQAKHPAKRRAPETVLDPSVHVPAVSSKKSATAKAPISAAGPPARKKPKKNTEDEERFRDSRGTGPRRKTEEGFAIYKEDELGITDQGGDTPLCPFDCQCCF